MRKPIAVLFFCSSLLIIISAFATDQHPLYTKAIQSFKVVVMKYEQMIIAKEMKK
jgi:hypothetical protein